MNTALETNRVVKRKRKVISLYTIKRAVLKVLKYGSLIFASAIFIVPILVVFFGAFKTRDEFYNGTSKIALPNSFVYFDNFKKAFTDGRMLNGFINTLIILVISVIITVLFGAMVAYVLQRFDFKLKKLVMALYMTAVLIPMVTTQVTTYRIMSKIDLIARNLNFKVIDSPISVILLYVGADVIGIVMLMQFLDSIPRDIDEAAMLEGASYPYIFFRLIFPLLKPAVATVVMIRSVAIYNDFYTQYLYIPGSKWKPISTALFVFKGPYGGEWNVICAGIILIMIPTLILFLAMQKYIYNGFASGSIK